MKLRYSLDKGAYPIEKAHKEDAGFDIKCPKNLVIPAYCSGTINTGVHVEIPQGYVGMIKSRSSMNFKKDLICEGVIDCGFTGSIGVKLYNLGENNQRIKIGDKIAQLVIMPIADIEEAEMVDEVIGGERGNGGFGSTGRWELNIFIQSTI